MSKKKQAVKRARKLSRDSMTSGESFEDLFDLKSIKEDFSINSINSMSLRSSEWSAGVVSDDSHKFKY